MITKFNEYTGKLNEAANTYQVTVNGKEFGLEGNHKDTLQVFKSAVDKAKDGDEILMKKIKDNKGKVVDEISKQQVIGAAPEKKESNRKGKKYYLETVLPVLLEMFETKPTIEIDDENPERVNMNGFYGPYAMGLYLMEKGFNKEDIHQLLYFINTDKELSKKLKHIKTKDFRNDTNSIKYYWDDFSTEEEAEEEKERLESTDREIFGDLLKSRSEQRKRSKSLQKTRKPAKKREYFDEEGNVITFGQWMAKKRLEKEQEVDFEDEPEFIEDDEGTV